jgi:hypothetical protein
MNDTRVSVRAWRFVLGVLIASIAIPIFLAIMITLQGSPAAQQIVWSGFDDHWSIDSGSIVGDQWQVQVISNSIGFAARSAPIELPAFAFQARVLTGDPHIATGLLINAQDQLNFTAFLISGDGYISLRERRSGMWLNRVPWQTWPHVRRDGQANVLRAECASNGCTFFVNDEVTLSDNNLSAGKSIGLITYANAPADRALAVIFDQLSAQALSDR